MTAPRPEWYLTPLSTWLVSTGRFAKDFDGLCHGLAKEMVAAGVPLWRLRLGVRTLHPLIAALSAAWERDGGVIPVPQASHGLENRPSYVGSPLEIIQNTGAPFRRDLRGALGADDHAVLQELKDRGATDYFGLPLRFTARPGGLMVLVTDHPEGFSDTDIKNFMALADHLAPIVEIVRLKHATTAITDAYLGPRSAARVLSGQITRGHVETIRAAILFSDLRGWTALNTRLPGEQTVALANRYYDILGTAIADHDGEILKLMGDGMLAIFPDTDDASACERALAAAQDAQAAAHRDPPLGAEFGIGMHVGEVLYGNVGSDARLDFTVLGSAVNLAARLEKLCITYSTPIVFSDAFAAQLNQPARHLGRNDLKGLDAPQDVFAP